MHEGHWRHQYIKDTQDIQALEGCVQVIAKTFNRYWNDLSKETSQRRQDNKDSAWLKLNNQQASA